MGINLILTANANPVTVSGGSYTPFFARAFQEGTLGNTLSSFDAATGHGQSTVYSNDITGPLGESKVVKVTTAAQWAAYGGAFLFEAGVPVATLAAEGDMWVRLYHYFPTAFCAGYDNAHSYTDGYGATKWLRWQFNSSSTYSSGTEGARLTYQLGGMANGACRAAGSSPRVTYMSLEGVGASPSVYFGTPHDYQSGQIIPRDQWRALQYQIHWNQTSGGWVRVWDNDTYIGQFDPDNGTATLPSSGYLTRLYLGDYWNGGAYSATSWYIANLICTRQQPTTVDSGGRPYIAPSADAATWE